MAWRPWGNPAFAEARRLDRPVLLSIGYSSCHWCHVMAHESFENDAIARIINERFVAVKVDREERPDVDEIYMAFVQQSVGGGGWPLTVFLAPDRTPFFGGTYFPPEDRWGRPGFPKILQGVAEAWRDRGRRAALLDQGEQLLEQQRLMARIPGAPQTLITREPVDAGVRQLLASHDSRFGGFGGAPKFPPARQVNLLLRRHLAEAHPDALEAARKTLGGMADGGLRDQIGGGFHRYSTDAEWRVPHFEKMLYDNALLVPVYVLAHRIGGEPRFAEVVRSAIDWARREMRSPEGAWRSALDADSEGEEGRFYAWTREESDALLGDDAALAAAAWDMRPEGNWEGRTVLRRVLSDRELGERFGVSEEETARRLASAGETLRRAREKRERPGIDDKALLAWNALWISALARAHRGLGEEGWLADAQATGRFLLERLRVQGRLFAVWDGIRARVPAMLDDHAFLLRALVDLYLSDFDEAWLVAADETAALLDRRFRAPEGGFHTVADDHEPLPVRTRSGYDGALPSGNAVAAEALLRLWQLTGASRHREAARGVITGFLPQATRAPAGFSTLLTAILRYLAEPAQIVVVGDRDQKATREAVRRLWRVPAGDAAAVLVADSRRAGTEDSLLPALRSAAAGVSLPEGGVSFLPCRGGVCSLPLPDLEAACDFLRSPSSRLA